MIAASIVHFIPYIIAYIAFKDIVCLPLWGVLVIMVGMDLYSFITAGLWNRK